MAREKQLQAEVTAAKGAASDEQAERDALRAQLDQQQQVCECLRVGRRGAGARGSAHVVLTPPPHTHTHTRS